MIQGRCQLLVWSFSQGPSHSFQHESVHVTGFLFHRTSDFTQISTCTGPIPHRDDRQSFHQPQQQWARLQTLLSSRLEQLPRYLQQRHFSSVICEKQFHISMISGYHPDRFLSDYDLRTSTSPDITVFSHTSLCP